jgi:hypothetical protein
VRRWQVLDYSAWVSHLPFSVEAIFVTPHSTAEQRAHAESVRAAMLAEWARRLSAAPPLLVYDPDRSLDEPFREYV